MVDGLNWRPAALTVIASGGRGGQRGGHRWRDPPVAADPHLRSGVPTLAVEGALAPRNLLILRQTLPALGSSKALVPSGNLARDLAREPLTQDDASAHRDVAIASGSAREVTAGEQQIHSVLETLPFVLVGLLGASNWPRFRSTWRQPSSWRPRRRDVPLSTRYLLAVAVTLTATGAIPYAEELARCVRHRGAAAGTPGRRV